MIVFTFKGHKISIRNDDWKKLKKRFNVENAKFDTKYADTIYGINVPCPFCDRFEGACTSCPVVREKTGISCRKLPVSFFKKSPLSMGWSSITWHKDFNSKARCQLKAILRRMEKIEASQ